MKCHHRNRQAIPPTLEITLLRQLWKLALWAKATGAMGDGTQRGDVDYGMVRFTATATAITAVLEKIWLMPNWAFALTCQ